MCLLAWYQVRFLRPIFGAFSCLWGRGRPWYGTFAKPRGHFTEGMFEKCWKNFRGNLVLEMCLRNTCMPYNQPIFREEQARLFLNQALAWVTPATFVIFVVFWGAKPLFSVSRMQIRHFRSFRQDDPFLAGDKSTVYQTRFVPPRFFVKFDWGRWWSSMNSWWVFRPRKNIQPTPPPCIGTGQMGLYANGVGRIKPDFAFSARSTPWTSENTWLQPDFGRTLTGF